MTTQQCRFTTKTGTPIGEIEVPIVDGRRPEFIKRGTKLYRHYKGATVIAPAEYREVTSELIEID